MRKKRHNYSAQEKVAILKRHLVDRVPISDLCDEYHLQPTVFYRWQKQFFGNGAISLKTTSSRKKKPEEQRILQLEENLQKKNEVLSELMEAHIQLKKDLGDL